MIRKCCAVLAVSLGLCSSSLAGTLTLSSTAVPTISLAPANDTLGLQAGSATVSGAGDFAFQTGDFKIGSSPIADQDIDFSFDEAVTLAGLTQTITIFGDDSVTEGLDVLTIHAGTPTLFGGYLFTLDSSAYSGTWVGQDVPVTLSAEITTTPEPGSLLLLFTGVLGGLAVLHWDRTVARSRSSRLAARAAGEETWPRRG